MDQSKLKPTFLNSMAQDEQDQPTNQQAIGIKPKINSKQTKKRTKTPRIHVQMNKKT